MKPEIEVQNKENKTKTVLNSVVEIKDCSKKPLIKVSENFIFCLKIRKTMGAYCFDT